MRRRIDCRGDFDHFVIVDIGDRLFQRHPARRGQPDRVILAARADVGQLLAFIGVGIDFEIVGLGVFADESFRQIDLHLRTDEQLAASLQHVERVGIGIAIAVGDQHAV